MLRVCSAKVISAIALAALLKACIVASRAPSCAVNGTECKAIIFSMTQAYNERIYLSIAFPLFGRVPKLFDTVGGARIEQNCEN